MVLHGKNRMLAMTHAFDGTVIEVEVGDLKRFRTWNAAGVAPHRESVVL
jgi:hypothetical protein